MVKIIQNYCLNQVIGEGQYGKVYKGTNMNTKLQVAIKVIKVDKFKQFPKLQECTVNQIDILSKVQYNPHIVKFIEILKTANNYYFVYQYCNGGTLEKLLHTQGPLTQKKALLYLKDLLSAFKSLSKMNIMHRDLKPGNILFHNNILKLADFGFCKSLSSSKDLAQTMLGYFLLQGSPIYMAPQILKGQIYTMKADIWSLGVVFYQMLFGFCPFEQSSIARLITLLEESMFKIPRQINNISKKTEELLNKMLIKDQFKRCSWDELFDYEITDQGQIFMKEKGFEYDLQKYRNASMQKNFTREYPLSQKNINNQQYVQNMGFMKKKEKKHQYINGQKGYQPEGASSILAGHSKCVQLSRKLHSLSWCYHPNPAPFIQHLMNKLLNLLLQTKKTIPDVHPQKQKIKEIFENQEAILREAGAKQIQSDWNWLHDYVSEIKNCQGRAFNIQDEQGKDVLYHLLELIETALMDKQSSYYPNQALKESKLSKSELIRLFQQKMIQL